MKCASRVQTGTPVIVFSGRVVFSCCENKAKGHDIWKKSAFDGAAGGAKRSCNRLGLGFRLVRQTVSPLMSDAEQRINARSMHVSCKHRRKLLCSQWWKAQVPNPFTGLVAAVDLVSFASCRRSERLTKLQMSMKLTKQ